MNKSPYKVIKSRYITEKSGMLQGLKNSESNACIKRCKSPKYVFLVENTANKIEIAKAIVSVGADFLANWVSPIESSHQYGKADFS